MSTVDVTDAASPQNVTLPPIDASPANDVEINDVEGGTATENAKKKRTRRKPHGKKNDVKNVKDEAQENAADEGIATDEPLEQNGDEEKPKKKRNRKKPTNPKSAGPNEVDRAEPVNEPQQEGKISFYQTEFAFSSCQYMSHFHFCICGLIFSTLNR